MENEEGDHSSFGSTVATIGSILIALGFAWMLALNWSAIPSALKIFILVSITIGAYAAGVAFRVHDYRKIGSSLFVLGALLYTLSIFLIAQIFSTSTSLQGVALLLLLAWTGILFSSYIFESSSCLVIALIQFLIWISLQYFAFIDLFNGSLSIGILAIIYLIIGVGLYGLTQIHKSINHKFAGVYRFWTALYTLSLTYILSFQYFLVSAWPRGFSLTSDILIFLIIISVVAIILAVIGVNMAINAYKLSGKEVSGFVLLTFLYILLIILSSLFSGESLFDGSISIGLWFMWLFDNALFILVILSVIGYGTRYHSSNLIDLAILFFVLDIVTRYIGFAFDFGGQIGFAFMSIIGGMLLIAGGWGIEKWRKGLMEKAAEKKMESYVVY